MAHLDIKAVCRNMEQLVEWQEQLEARVSCCLSGLLQKKRPRGAFNNYKADVIPACARRFLMIKIEPQGPSIPAPRKENFGKPRKKNERTPGRINQ
jgi:hypothetical protein